MAIPPCTKGKHSAEEPETKPAPKAAASAPTAVNGGVEVYGAPKPKPEAVPSAQVPTTAAAPVPVPAEPKEEEQDDPDVPVPAGAKCKRLGCGAEWKGEESRGEVCVYHPQSVSILSLRHANSSLSSTKARKATFAASAECSSSPSFSRSKAVRRGSIFSWARRTTARRQKRCRFGWTITRRRWRCTLVLMPRSECCEC